MYFAESFRGCLVTSPEHYADRLSQLKLPTISDSTERELRMDTEDRASNSNANVVDIAQAKFELERWQAEEDIKLKLGELEIKREDIRLRNDELRIKEKELTRSKWSNPLMLAIVGLATTLLVSTVQSCSQAESNRNLERQRFESTLIQKTLELPTQEKSAERLKFLLQVGLIKDETGKIKYYVDNPTEIPLQGVTFSSSEVLTPDIKSGVEKSLAKFQRYLTGMGFDIAGRKITVNITSKAEVQANAFIEDIKGLPTLSLGPSVAKDETAILQQYALYILRSHRADLKVEDEEQHRALAALWWGLADYLNCSYRNDPVVGPILGPQLKLPYLRNLDNQLKFSEMDEHTSVYKAGETWGGALWELRDKLGQDLADKVFFDVWANVQRNDDAQRIVQRILDSDQSIESGKHAEEIRTVFTRRDLKL